MAYDQKWMHAQTHPLWRNNPMRPSRQTIGAKGCFISCLTYIRSRKENKDYGIPEQVKEMSAHRGFDHNGVTQWDVVRKVMHLTISRIKPRSGRIYIMRNVLVHGANNQLFTHWVVELSGGQMYDPLFAGGQFVRPINFYPPVGNNKRYVI